MEDHLAQLLAATQSSAPGPRQQAEENLQQLYANEELPLSLATLASRDTVHLATRQAALLNLKNYVLAAWSPEFDEYKGQVLLGDDTKSRVRDILLELSTTESGVDRKVQSAASYVVSKIASADFPDQWPGLLQILLGILQSNPSDARLHGTLKVLAELVSDGLDENQFFPIAQELVNNLYAVASNQQRRPKLRALAVSVFKECFNTLQVISETHKAAVKAFAEQTLAGWIDLLLDVINTHLPTPPGNDDGGEDGPLEHFRGLIALKVQVSRVLIAIRMQFPSVISPSSPTLFSSIWDELSRMLPAYQARYIDDDVESRLEDADGLPYTLDFLVLEDLDFMQGCLRAPPVRKELEKQLSGQAAESNWVIEFLKLTSAYAQITVEEQGMWEIDVNVFLAEETSVTANYTTRTACGDLAVKLADWLREKALEALLIYSSTLFQTTNDDGWRLREAVLFLLDQVLSDWQDYDRKLTSTISEALVSLAAAAQQQGNAFLRARAYYVLSNLLRASDESTRSKAPDLLQKNLQGIHNDASEVVQVSCVRALQNYLRTLPPSVTHPLQTPIINALQAWLSSKELSELSDSDELLFTLVESLRDIILLDTSVCLSGNGLNILFNVVSHGAENFQMTNLVSETFEEICSTISPLGAEAYTQLCQRVLPSLTGAFDVGNMTAENALTSLAAELLTSLTQHAPSPLPPTFVAAVMPKLSVLLLNNTDDELLKSCTVSLKNILTHDSAQLLSYVQPTGAAAHPATSAPTGKPGLEIVLQIVDRLLSPDLTSDNASAEIGSVAAALIEHVGSVQLGTYLVPLLTAVAQRIAGAEKAHLVQSLVMVFARLAANNSAKDVVDFLSSISVFSPKANAQQPGLDVVMTIWLNDATPSLAGYEDIRLNVLALTKLYELQDPRLRNVQCKGDMIVNPETSGRIMTRSRAKAQPEQYEQVPVDVKVVKLLVEELASAAAVAQAPPTPGLAKVISAGLAGPGDATVDGGSDDDSEWEDDMEESELLKFANEEPGSARTAADGETVAFLEGWFRGVGAQQGFVENVFERLNEGEKETLRRLG